MVSAVVGHPIEFEKELKNTKVNGLISLLRHLRDKEVQKGISIMLVFLKLIGRYWEKIS